MNIKQKLVQLRKGTKMIKRDQSVLLENLFNDCFHPRKLSDLQKDIIKISLELVYVSGLRDGVTEYFELINSNLSK